jgi:hypothetical protein
MRVAWIIEANYRNRGGFVDEMWEPRAAARERVRGLKISHPVPGWRFRLVKYVPERP